MFKKHSTQYIVGAIAAIVTVILSIYIYATISKVEDVGCFMQDTKENNFGWSYEVLTNEGIIEAKPEYSTNFLCGFPSLSLQAVKASRVMVEDLENAEIRFQSMGKGIEVYIDDSLLYSDFSNVSHDENGFIISKDGTYTKATATDTVF